MAHYLVTGGCGFIGSHLVEKLLAEGHQVSVLDDLSTGKGANIPDSVPFTEGSITDKATVQKCFEGIDGCFHLAAIASVQKSVEDWAGTHEVNLTGTINIFDQARVNNTPILYVSSAATYGDNPNQPLKESELPKPLTAYGADKLGCEHHGYVASKVFGIPTVGFRLFNIYGPRQDPSSPYSGVISIFMDRISKGQAVKIFGDGTQNRDFVYVADVARIFSEAMNKLQAGSNNGEVYNIARGNSVTIKELADIIGECAGVTAVINHEAAREGDIKNSCGSNEKLKQDLSTSPEIDLKVGLKMTYDFFTHTPQAEPPQLVSNN